MRKVDSKTTVEEFGTVGVLYALEEAGRTSTCKLRTEDFQETFRQENWRISQDP